MVEEVEGKLVARNGKGETLDLGTNPGWVMEKGQVIHPTQRKPLVGDYDLLGVIDPKAPGRNIAVAAEDGQVLKDWTNPETSASQSN